jgi:chromosome segregation ATPase
VTEADLVVQILRAIQGEVAALRADMAEVRLEVTSHSRQFNALQQDVRMVRSAINDMARAAPTVGEIEALHTDVNRVQAENTELAGKVATLERLVRELQR